MKNRIRVNGVLYEAVGKQINEKVHHTDKGADYSDMLPSEYRKYRWAQPFERGGDASISRYSNPLGNQEGVKWTLDIICCRTDEYDYNVVAVLDITEINDQIPRNPFGIRKAGYYEFILEGEGYDKFFRLIDTLDNNYFTLKFLLNSLRRRGFVLRKKKAH